MLTPGARMARAPAEPRMSEDQVPNQQPTDPESAESQAPSQEQAPSAPETSEEASEENAGNADEIAAAALASAQAAIDALNEDDESGSPSAPAPGAADPAGAQPASGEPSNFQFQDFAAAIGQSVPKGMDLLSDVNVDVTIELGRTRMLVEDVLRLAEGAVVELDKLAGDPVDIYVNKRLVARGEVLVLNDNFCIRVNEILDADLVEQNA